ncbi:twin-arginine translocation signal domain-containing protein [Bradyrhizobium sp. 160]|nr:twin-arginine translocation signal domain-containing protein [Bradyrhizobium sp. 160]
MSTSRREFLKGAASTAALGAGFSLAGVTGAPVIRPAILALTHF